MKLNINTSNFYKKMIVQKTPKLLLLFFLMSSFVFSQDKGFEAYKKEQETKLEAYKNDYYAGLDSINKKFNAYLNDENERYNAYKNTGVIPAEAKKRVDYVEKLFPKGLAKISLKQSESKLIEINKVWKKQLKNIKENKKVKKEDLVIRIKPSPKKEVLIKKSKKLKTKRSKLF